MKKRKMSYQQVKAGSAYQKLKWFYKNTIKYYKDHFNREVFIYEKEEK